MDDLREIYNLTDKGKGALAEQEDQNLQLFRDRIEGKKVTLDSPDFDELMEITIKTTTPGDKLECDFIVYWEDEKGEIWSCPIKRGCNISNIRS